MKEIRAVVRKGAIIEAQDAADEATAKATQRPLTTAERRGSVIRMAGRHPDWGAQGEIAKRLNMSQENVSKVLQAEKVNAAVGQFSNIANLPDTVWRAVGEGNKAVWPLLARLATTSGTRGH